MPKSMAAMGHSRYYAGELAIIDQEIRSSLGRSDLHQQPNLSSTLLLTERARDKLAYN